MYFLLLRRSSGRTDVCPGLLRPPAFPRLDLSIHDARRQNSAGAVTRTRISTTTKANFSTMAQASAPGIAALDLSGATQRFLALSVVAVRDLSGASQRFPGVRFRCLRGGSEVPRQYAPGWRLPAAEDVPGSGICYGGRPCGLRPRRPRGGGR